MIDGVEPHALVKQMGLGYNQDLKLKLLIMEKTSYST